MSWVTFYCLNRVLLPLCLCLLRLGLALIFLPWIITRFEFIRFEGKDELLALYSQIGAMPDTMGWIIGLFWLGLICAFVLGLQKGWSYGLVFVLYVLGVSLTVPTFQFGMSFDAFCWLVGGIFLISVSLGLLFVLRDKDQWLTVKGAVSVGKSFEGIELL